MYEQSNYADGRDNEKEALYKYNQPMGGTHDEAKRVPEKQPQVSGEMESLIRACEALHNALGQLEDELSPILTLSLSGLDNRKDEVVGSLTPLAENIRARRFSIEAAQRLVNSMVSRLEL